jgi:4-hydroxyphenylpyruvate dioxygenase
MVRDHGLVITVFQPFRDFEGLVGPLRTRAFARAARKFELMNQLGTDLMLVCSSLHPSVLGGIDRMAEDVHELGELAESFGVRVSFEALAWGGTSVLVALLSYAVRQGAHPDRRCRGSGRPRAVTGD